MPLFDVRLWALDASAKAGPQWRSCRIVVEPHAALHTTTVAITVRRRSDGSSIQQLHASKAFRGVLDDLLMRIIGHVTITTDEGGYMRDTVLFDTIAHGFHDPARKGSPSLSFQLDEDHTATFLALSNHAVLDIAARAQAVADQQASARTRTLTQGLT